MDKVALAANIAGTVGQTVATYKSAGAAQNTGAAGAQSERIAGNYNATRSRELSRRTLSKGPAIAGASGLDISSGTPLDIMLESAKQAELDALAIQRDAEVRARTASARGKIAGMEKGPLVAQGIVRGSTYLSQWYNDYGLT